MGRNFSSDGLSRDSGLHEQSSSISSDCAAIKDHSTVFVIDDDLAILTRLTTLFTNNGFRTVGFQSAEEFLAHRKPFGPACLVLEADLPAGTGLDLQRQLAEAGVCLPIVFMARCADVRTAISAMKAGAVDYLLKPFGERELLDAVVRALKHDAEVIRQQGEMAELQRRYSRLTSREREVLIRTVSGKLNKQVASELALSEGTVKVYRHRIMKKMQATSLADLVRMIDRLSG